MKFKEGDIVVCIDVSANNLLDDSQNEYLFSFLKLNKKYKIYRTIGTEFVLKGIPISYHEKRFKLLSEIRKEKINKLKNE